MTFCCGFTFAAWFEMFVSFVCIYPYKHGLITLNDSQNPISNISEAVQVTKFFNSIPLLIFSFVTWHYVATCISGIAIFTLERAVASFLFSDYEKLPRRYISFGLLSFSQFVVFEFTFCLFFYILNFSNAIKCALVFVGSAVILFIFLLYYNINLRNKLDLKYVTTAYSLASRFQAAENARSLKLAVRVMIVITVLAIIAFTVTCAFKIQLLHPDFNMALINIFEGVFLFNPLFVAPAAIISVKEWKEAFYQKIPFLRNRIKPANKATQRRLSIETDLYFVQLRDSWS
ncbi:unnamed protein product [Caenorhabditis bovis]|uniref:Serpentine Receptor, class E (Epsilon) n=1 Tax=Caenorhabditis bovis TaxID=2654633 RepID=A0A8S1FES7_9PELO|nr:unnamed protein product [Caenorhabditis bovis]